MTTGQMQKRSTMFFEHCDSPINIYRNFNKNLPTLKNEATRKLNKKNILSIDDMDMISLKTDFDKQMVLGSPMYLESDEEIEITKEYNNNLAFDLQFCNDNNTNIDNCCQKVVPTNSKHFCFKGIKNCKNPVLQLTSIRRKYITSSFQDNKLNAKYNIDTWLLYPKPLPKFWKFEKDDRFKRQNSELDFLNTSEYLIHKKPGIRDISYTGKYFDINQYQEEFSKFRELREKDCTFIKNDCRKIPNFTEFRKDFEYVIGIIQNHNINSMSEKRLSYLLNKFDLFQHLKSNSEVLENKQVPYRDFYNSRKVDQDLLLSGIISQRQLSEFIWNKINYEADKIVYCTSNNEKLTVKDFFQFGKENGEKTLDIGLKLIDDEFLDWYKNIYLVTYHIIQLPLKQIENILTGKQFRYFLIANTFLEFDNYIEGQYLAEILIKYSIHPLEKSKYQLVQISIDYQFMNKNDNCNSNWWVKFAKWVVKWKLISHNIRWNIRISRVFSNLFKYKMVRNFEEYFDLFFEPLISEQNNINLQYCLSTVCSFDIVISQSDEYLWNEFPDINLSPKEWIANGDNPTISHYMYYFYVRLSAFNQMRYEKNLNTITLRSYCSPTASTRSSQFSIHDNFFTESIESLVCNLLLCNGGLLRGEGLWLAPATLEYLFYLFQIPIIAAPLSSISLHSSLIQHPISETFYYSNVNNSRNKNNINHSRDVTVEEQTSYRNNPFMNLVKIGFKVSISSKSILFNSSYTLEPLIEEYSVAASIYLLNAADLCELARNSVLCSGYEGFYKAHWTGVLSMALDNSPISEMIGLTDIWYDKREDTRIKHNVPNIRRKYRIDTLNQEWDFIDSRFV
ncbi:metallo-dependent hydrolase superfamily protein PWA37_005159 [Arxiozyma heterogenica]|uniref:metallo-dependent hydrolase superfamily protein n=1 Tax=Arxiozyma heterogenica TaxID=278026 RepID=UPI002F1F2289